MRKSAPKSSELNARRGEECWQRGRRSPATQRGTAEMLQLHLSKAVLVTRNTQSTQHHPCCRGHKRVCTMTSGFNRAYPVKLLKNERKFKNWAFRAPQLWRLLYCSWGPTSLRAGAERLSNKRYVAHRAAQPHRPCVILQGWSRAWKSVLEWGGPHQNVRDTFITSLLGLRKQQQANREGSHCQVRQLKLMI